MFVAALQWSDGLGRALAVLDRTLSINTHKIGVIYVGPNQSTLDEALRNRDGNLNLAYESLLF